MQNYEKKIKPFSHRRFKGKQVFCLYQKNGPIIKFSMFVLECFGIVNMYPNTSIEHLWDYGNNKMEYQMLNRLSKDKKNIKATYSF